MISKNKNLKIVLLLQIAVLIYSLSSVAGKFASRYEFLSFGYILSYGIEIMFLGVYAIFWQQLIKKTDISIAYANRAIAIFWSMILAFLIFKETITIKNIVGVIIIFIGTILVNKSE